MAAGTWSQEMTFSSNFEQLDFLLGEEMRKKVCVGKLTMRRAYS